MAPAHSRARPGRAVWLALGAIPVLLSTLLAELACRITDAEPPGVPWAWAADRDACALLSLESTLAVRERVPLPWPVAVEPGPRGGAWAVCATAGGPSGRHALVRVDSQGRVRLRLELGPVHDLWSAGGDAWIVEASTAERVERVARVRGAGVRASNALVRGARCAAASGEWVLVGTLDGLQLLWPEGGLRARQALPGGVADVAPAPAGCWWALERGEPPRLHLVGGADSGGSLPLLWSRELEGGEAWAAPIPGVERAWLPGPRERVERLGPLGTLERRSEALGCTLLGPATAARSGTLLLASAGALLLVGPDGAARSQGGFTYLADVAIAELGDE